VGHSTHQGNFFFLCQNVATQEIAYTCLQVCGTYLINVGQQKVANPYPTNVENRVRLIIMPENSGLAEGMFL